MLRKEWSLTEGPEWAASVDEADPRDGYFERNLETMRIALGVNPYYESYAFLDDDRVRVWRTLDSAAGYRLWVFFELDPATKTCELKWMRRIDL